MGEGSDSHDRFVEIHRHFPVPPDELWEMLTKPDEIARWLAPGRIEPNEGGEVLLVFGDDERTSGLVTRWDPPNLLEYTWQWRDEPESRVRFELEAANDGTALRLVHRLLPAGGKEDYGPGWEAHLDVLDGQARGIAVEWQDRFRVRRAAWSSTSVGG